MRRDDVDINAETACHRRLLATAPKYTTFDLFKDGNEFRKQIAYIAKIKFIWNRITLVDARKINEFQKLFADKSINAEMSTWYKEEQTLHIALTGEPLKLKKPIPLGKKNLARVLSKRRYSFVDILNASTIDDLF